MTPADRTLEEQVLAIAQIIASCSSGPSEALRCFTICVQGFARSSWPDLVWRFSPLMAGGGPLEFVFSSNDNALRYTVETAGPEVPLHAKIGAASSLLTRLGCPPPSSQLVQAWQQLQAGSSLRWGAWLGLRHGPQGTRAKVYIEVPSGRSLSSALCPPARTLFGSRLCMIGYEPAPQRTELYFSKPHSQPRDLEELLALVALPQQRRALLARFTTLLGMPARSALRWATLGYSLAHAADEPPQLALFVRAKALLGGSVALRHQLLDHEFAAFSSNSTYRQLIAPLPDEDLPDHGVVTCTVGTNGEPMLRVGVSGSALGASFARRARDPNVTADAVTCR